MAQNFPFDHFLKLDSFNHEVANPHKYPKNEPVLPIKDNLPNKTETLTVEEFSADELKTITCELLEQIKGFISPSKFHAYFANTFTVSSINTDAVEFVVTTAFIKKVIESHYIEVIKQSLTDILGKKYDIKINILNSTNSLSSNNDNIVSKRNTPKRNENIRNTTFIIEDLNPTQDDLFKAVDSQVIEHLNAPNTTQIDPTKTFSNFIVGPSNNMAYAFSMAVAKEPGKTYSAFYIYGNSGLGKTHLIHAIANYIQLNNPSYRICITSANRFMNELVQAVQDNKILQFRKNYTEKTDVLIIDDIHELKNRSRTQDEFFHIFNELIEKGKQLIFTSDKLPKEIDGIEDRIRTRLSGALPIEIQQPDLETRIAILKRKAQEKDIYLSEDVVNLIAKCVKNNIRELEGCLIKLEAVNSLLKVDIDLEVAREHLNLSEELENQKFLTIESIAKAVSNYYKTPIGDLRGKTKSKDIVQPRQVAMYLIIKFLKPTLKECGQYFGGRDHSTVLHAINTIQNRIKAEAVLAQQVLEIEKNL